MATSQPALKVTSDGEITRVQFLERNILDASAIREIGDQITQVIDQTPNPKVLISFENVEHLSSAALGALISINHHSRQKGGQLRLAEIDSQIQEVFAITKLDRVFQIYQTADAAAASFT